MDKLGNTIGRVIGAIKSPEGILGSLLVLGRGAILVIDRAAEIDFLNTHWGDLGSFLASGWGTLIIVGGGLLLIAHSIRKGLAHSAEEASSGQRTPAPAQSAMEESPVTPPAPTLPYIPKNPRFRPASVGIWQKNGRISDASDNVIRGYEAGIVQDGPGEQRAARNDITALSMSRGANEITPVDQSKLMPIARAIQHIAGRMGDSDSNNHFAATRSQIRDRAMDDRLHLRGRRETSRSPDTGVSEFTANYEDVSKIYWLDFVINAMAGQEDRAALSHTELWTPELWNPKDAANVAHYADLQALEDEIMATWP